MDLKIAYEILIEFLIGKAKNEKYKKDLQTMHSALKREKTIVQENHPKHLSLLMGYNDLFLFPDNLVISMAKYIKEEKLC